MEWNVVIVFVFVLVCPLTSFLIARATCRNYRNQKIAAEVNALLSHIEVQQEVNDAQVVVNEALEAKLDAQNTELEIRHQVIVSALISIREIFNLVENSDDAELTRKKFVELRIVLNTLLNTWRED